VSKRVRGPIHTHRRPGARPPSERGTVRRRELIEGPSQLEVAEVVAEDVVEHRPAAAAAELERAARPTVRVHHKIKAGSVLAARAATEYVYVSQDMRRIVVVAGVLVALLFVLWLLLVVMRVIALPFY
jgi:hypothetical protein